MKTSLLAGKEKPLFGSTCLGFLDRCKMQNTFVLVLVFKISLILSFHVRFVGFVVHVLRAVFHHELRASFDVDE